MKLKFALATLAGLTAIAAAGSASAAMLVDKSTATAPASNVENVRWVCDIYGRCFHRPNFYGPRFYGGYGPPRPRFYGGYGYGGPRYYGGGYRRW